MSNVVQIESMRLTRAQRTYLPTGCKHMNLTMDEHGDVVSCDDCGKQVSAFWALQMLAEEYGKAFAKLERRAQQQAKSERDGIHLKAAQVVESAWRSRTMVPVCPHCSEPIFAHDGLGRAQINKQMAERRRAAQASESSPVGADRRE